MRRLALALSLVTITVAIAVPSVALASTSDVIHVDCQDGRIDGTYTQKQYRDALRTIQTALDEYSDCRDVIRRAQLAAAGKRSSGAKGSGATRTGRTADDGATGGTTQAPASTGGTAAQILADASPTERSAVTKAIQSSEIPVIVGGRAVAPDASSAPAGAAN
ncbi:MAG: hypothetical protein ACR2NB_11755, partial [Solirubrobacteraceae bacterium]